MQVPLPVDLPRNPDAAFAALARAPHPFWLDSGDRPTPHGRWHLLGLASSRWLRVSEEDPFPELRAFLSALPPGEPTPVPAARVVGYLAYDCGRFLERLPDPGPRNGLDEAAFAAIDACVTYDLATGGAWLTAMDDAAADDLCRALRAPPIEDARGPLSHGVPRPGATEAEYAAEVAAVRERIAAGEVYQVNLSHRFTSRLSPGVAPAALYRRLREQHPAPFGAFLDTGKAALVSNSPEGFLSVDLGDRHVATWPLKGTRPRSTPPDELLADPKDRAEHVMIVDLERNDFGRVAVPGSVRVPALLEVVTHSTVHHLESRVEATLRPGIDLVDVLAATFPGGSITGAPKIRAMRIIAEMERERRGPYCGALGAVLFGGGRSIWSLPIRTAVVTGSELELRVGGGIVADSDPRAEYAETLVKARAFLDVLR